MKVMLIYVIQKHQARNLHFDFRLEMNGILKSWVLPKGPPERSIEKRLAILVEDHPLEYAKFSGVIPSGYGAGTVEIWDSGTWEPLVDIDNSLKSGHLRFEIHGEKLKGIWSLVRFKGANNWLLFKHSEILPILPGMKLSFGEK